MFSVSRNRVATVALVPVALLTASLTACSSSDNNPVSSFTPFDSGSVPVPEAGPQPTPITVQVQGHGTVYSADVHPADGGLVGTFTCGASSTPAQCTAPLRATLYALAEPDYILARWTTTGLAASADLGHGSNSYTVGTSSPSPLIAVFVPLGTTGVSDAGTTADDGGDSGQGPDDAGGPG